ncbi:hypothetical protein GH721_14510 [Kriegella sp. EG-1]|nr:hypothetical protein [Flavobacteriaceae bacterium EG-1]
MIQRKMRQLSRLCVLLFISNAVAQSPWQTNNNPYAVSTYENIGLYWTTAQSGTCSVAYKIAKSKTWQKGLDLVFDARSKQYRGSIINLLPATTYEVKLSTSASSTKLKVTTRSDSFPIGKTTTLPAGESSKAIVITESGTPEAYHLVTVPQGENSTIDARNSFEHAIEIDADFVIVRGVEIRNTKIHGIRIKEKRHDIVIENCHITFWGRMGGAISYGNTIGNYDSGIFAEDGTWNLTIQRNLIDHPRGGSNDWETGHPAGPQGITIEQSNGGNVIRYNDILATEDHGFNDAIGGGSNYSNIGNMHRDSDIYGNLIRNVWDDAIEVEGSNMNIRVYNNYMHLFFAAIATASTTHGPIYIYRNVVGESRIGHENSNGGVFIKTGERDPYAGGRRYVFHNSIVQPQGVRDAFTGHSVSNIISRNNIFDVPGRLASNKETVSDSDYDYDYFSGRNKGVAKEENGINFYTTPSNTPLFIPSYKLEFYPKTTVNSIKWGRYPHQFGDKEVMITDPVIQLKSPLIDGGVPIDGFNDHYVGKGPDLGAFERGKPAIEFGRRAYLKYDEGWCPWE